MNARIWIAATLVAVAACGRDTTEPTLPATSAPAASRIASAAVGRVYSLSNAVTGNDVLEYARAADGQLTWMASYPTGGAGTGAGLGSQGAVTLSDDARLLLAVDAGSNEITSFRVTERGLTRVTTVPSGGTKPISITIHGSFVYVLNAGGTGNISGFTIDAAGNLSPIAGSTRSLGGAAVDPAQVSFAPNGRVLAVTEKAANAIAIYRVSSVGLPGQPITNASAGQTPFGFTFDQKGTLIVSEAFGGAALASAMSSYHVADNGTLQVISASVPTHQTAACWAVVVNNGRFTYASNTGSASVSGYAVWNGALTLLNADGRTGVTGAGPADAALSQNSQFLYTRNGADHSISEFKVDNDTGALTSIGIVSGLPASAVGLAAR